MREPTSFVIGAVALYWFMSFSFLNSTSLGTTQENSTTLLDNIILDHFSTERRWWSEGKLFCGKNAPLYDGYYPVCDPFNPKTPCCSYYGHCGSSADHCNCTGCVDYSKNPELLVKEPVRPTTDIRWHSLSNVNWSLPVCGPNAPLVDGYEAICNPDHDYRHCCSENGFCGHGSAYCDCEGCKNFRKTPSNNLGGVQGKAELRSIILEFLRKEKRWWAWEDEPKKRGMCGKMAPLYNGYYPVCNPFSKAQCCNEFGYCGSNCNCTRCVNYAEHPEKLLEEPIRPSQEIRWHLISDNIDWDQPICGAKAPKVGGNEAICNPDDDFKHCCSEYGFCGYGPEYCECNGCKDFRKRRISAGSPQVLPSSELRTVILDYLLTRKRWWTEKDDTKKVGLCGKRAPLYDGRYPVCDPFNSKTPCCSYEGHCGSSENHCNCTGCVDYSKNPVMLVTESGRPTGDVRWHTLSDGIHPSHPKCGPRAPSINGSEAICNPDDDYRHCCSKHGFCGRGPEYCECTECIDFRNISTSKIYDSNTKVGLKNSGNRSNSLQKSRTASTVYSDVEVGEIQNVQTTPIIDHN